jgi:hypothetical protein
MPGGYLELAAVIGLYPASCYGRHVGHERSRPRCTS